MSRFTPRPQSTSFFDRVFGSSGDSSAHQLDEWLESTLKRELKLDSIERDDDGDIVLVSGSAVVYVSTSDDGTPWIAVFSPLLEGFAMRPEVYEAVNAINRNTPNAKATVDPDGPQIVLSAELYIFDGLSPEQLMATIDHIADRADHYDTRLQKRFGGHTMLDDDDGDEFDV